MQKNIRSRELEEYEICFPSLKTEHLGFFIEFTAPKIPEVLIRLEKRFSATGNIKNFEKHQTFEKKIFCESFFH